MIGGGAAGLRAAISAAETGARVALVTKGTVGRSGSSPMAGGGLAAVLGGVPEDSWEAHYQDSLTNGHHLADRDLLSLMCREAPERVRELRDWGARFKPNPYLHLAGHRFPRGAFIKGNQIQSVLRKKLRSYPNCHPFEDHIVTRLVAPEGRIRGLVAVDARSGEVVGLTAPAVVLATGGVGDLYQLSTNCPHGVSGYTTGTGYALALRAGASLVDMEMVQFYPNVLWYPEICRGIIFSIEVVAGLLGGRLVNGRGEAFLDQGGPLLRDRISKLAYEEIRAGRATPEGGLIWDFGGSDPERVREVFSTIGREFISTYEHLERIGLPDPTSLQVRPGQHFICGGISIDSHGRTGVDGLFAAGEVAGNLHGANRLAGNAVAEALVFGRRAGIGAADWARGRSNQGIPVQDVRDQELFISRLTDRTAGPRPQAVLDLIKELMETYAGPSREASGLRRVVSRLEELRRMALDSMRVQGGRRFSLDLIRAVEIELQLETAMAIARAAEFRTESRGVHQRTDYAGISPDWDLHTVVIYRLGKPQVGRQAVRSESLGGGVDDAQTSG